MISSVRLPTVLVLVPTLVPIVFGLFPLLPNTLLAERVLLLTIRQVKLFLQSEHLDMRWLLSRQDGSFRSLALPGHERYWDGFSFLQIVLSHHTDQRSVLGADTNTFLLCLRQPFIVWRRREM